MSGNDRHRVDVVDGVPVRLLGAAADFAVGVAAAGLRLRPVLSPPAELRPFARSQRVPPSAVGKVLRIVESDAEFSARVASLVTPDALDEAGVLWLTRPDGWRERLAELAAEDLSVDAAAALRRSERRREVAETRAATAAAEIAVLRAQVEVLAAAAAERADAGRVVEDDLAALRAQLAAARLETRRADDRVRAAEAREVAARARADEAVERASAAERVRDEVLASRAVLAATRPAPADDDGSSAVVLEGAARLAAQLDEQIESAADLARVLSRLRQALSTLEPVVRTGPGTGRGAPSGRSGGAPGGGSGGQGLRRRGSGAARRPIGLPGGVYGSSSAAAEHLVRVPGVVVLVDGYNVAKLAWPALDLDHQRDRCISACEDVARRSGTDVAVVFDGSNVVGATAQRRRLVRVRFSPEGVTADDVLRDEVAGLRADVPVVVVTNDQAVVADVRSHGANVLTSQQWLELAGR